ncbi:hypothetical protein B5F40_11990 [Gordonibacter sp. An230]|uniref:hypothetical protein n=1 Tax=Gordonibacter sp. An230 TaxID=1965592 RepID=UPI000B3938B6|nr:hypothetical protein [Gordonibacter sp. An230]OUO88922.1 hypothetical protein B5F40_11990 [Gordonibacter sp. An230]
MKGMERAILQIEDAQGANRKRRALLEEAWDDFERFSLWRRSWLDECAASTPSGPQGQGRLFRLLQMSEALEAECRTTVGDLLDENLEERSSLDRRREELYERHLRALREEDGR